jgi:hypothetical protein
MSLLNLLWRLQLGVEFGSKLITLPGPDRREAAVLGYELPLYYALVLLQRGGCVSCSPPPSLLPCPTFFLLKYTYTDTASAGCFLIYDVTSRRSFDSMRTWLADVRAHADAHISCVLVGNKDDLVGRGAEGECDPSSSSMCVFSWRWGSGEGPVRERGEAARISGERKSEAGGGKRGEVSKICMPAHRPQLLAAGQAEPERPEAGRVGVGVGCSRACRARCVTGRSALVPM